MNNNNNNRGIFYGVIGVATLVVAIIGATFAYFTAITDGGKNELKANTASIALGLTVEKVSDADDKNGGMIPLSNSMIERAVYGKAGAVKKNLETLGGENYPQDICVDDNGNAVCQIYKIVVTNNSTASVFVDGYVSLKGGSGVPVDFPNASYKSGSKFAPGVLTSTSDDGYGTTMRWTQVVKDSTDDTYSTGGTVQLGATEAESVTIGTKGTGIGLASDDGSVKTTADNGANIVNGTNDASFMGKLNINSTSGGTDGSSKYDVINKNFIRVSNHKWATGVENHELYDRTADMSSALVFNQFLDTSTHKTATYYIAVWLNENGANQTARAASDTDSALGVPTSASGFFGGNVTFMSAQGNEVSATFQSYARVTSNNATKNHLADNS